MEFTASDGKIISEFKIRDELSFIIRALKIDKETDILFWEREFLEWFLDREVEPEKFKEESFLIQLHKDITEEELEQLEQLKDYLKV